MCMGTVSSMHVSVCLHVHSDVCCACTHTMHICSMYVRMCSYVFVCTYICTEYVRTRLYVSFDIRAVVAYLSNNPVAVV